MLPRWDKTEIMVQGLDSFVDVGQWPCNMSVFLFHRVQKWFNGLRENYQYAPY